ncbi:MGMT family protein [Desnuesiella massiliensis]|uniref:MGMT family protein n=1 Tax=Desnuesiella massiliensis TaxID=1650662 RepID=UPI0006E1BBD6|nr:MGMT family protein [Desnuesiella massiliensis]
MQPFTERVVKIIGNIPKGKVMTYGQIAFLCGSPRAARQVVRILHSLSHKYNLPWHRVINSQGKVAIKDSSANMLQKDLLIEENISFIDDSTVDLDEYQYHPSTDEFL